MGWLIIFGKNTEYFPYLLNLFTFYSLLYSIYSLSLYLLYSFIRKIIKLKTFWFFSWFAGFHVSFGFMFIGFNMVSEQSNNETLENSLGKPQTKTEAIAAAIEKLLYRIQKPSIYTVGQPSTSSVQSNSQKVPHAPPLSNVWAQALPFVHLTAHPRRFYASSPVQTSHPFGHSQPYESPTPSSYGQPWNPSLHASVSFDPLQQPYVCGSRINQIYSRAAFEVGVSLAQSKSTALPMYSKNPVTSLPNVPSNYITNLVAFNARFLTHDKEKNSGKPILICEQCNYITNMVPKR